MKKGKHKLDVTRPDFLNIFLSNIVDSNSKLTRLESLSEIEYRIVYTAYSVIMESNVDRHDIVYLRSDGESVVIGFKTKKMAKLICENLKKDTVRIGQTLYRIKTRTDGSYVIVSLIDNGSAFQDSSQYC